MSFDMSYPSIITQPGSALRNVEPITEALYELLEQNSTPDHPTKEPSRKLEGVDDETAGGSKRRILEIGSGDCTHIKHWSNRWPEVEWFPTGRNDGEVKTITDCIRSSSESSGISNVGPVSELDIGFEESWNRWEEQARASTKGFVSKEQHASSNQAIFDGVILVNIVHCCPASYPENVFRHFSPLRPCTSVTQPLLNRETGWIAVYSPFLADDGSYKSEGDEKFDQEYIRAKSDLLGLRTISSLSELAERWGFREEARREMPKGNMWVVWRARILIYP